eukprot:NODE_304_length_10309_cov_0.478355.p3 type:complete len:314 gc:universal NODE_304_length_10309_cov_0.478355:3744-4685(+)
MLWISILHAKYCKTNNPSEAMLINVSPHIEKRDTLSTMPQIAQFNMQSRHIVPVFWHVIHDEAMHKLTEGTIIHQINKLNEAYKNTTIYFQLSGINYVNSKELVHLECCETEKEKQMKLKYRQGTKAVLNIYSADSGYHETYMYIWKSKKSSVSWSTFPDSEIAQDGVVVSTDRLSYDNQVPSTLVHEIGHWLGLLHTFRGGCNDEFDDYVTDTAKVDEKSRTSQWGRAAVSWSYQCNALIDTCPNSPGTDNIYSYMDYTNCRRMFTLGQRDRIEYFRAQYRPSQLSCTVSQCSPVTPTLYQSILPRLAVANQ